MVVIPEVEVFHDYDKVSRLYCPNGALIELDRKDGSGQVIFKDVYKRQSLRYLLK